MTEDPQYGRVLRDYEPTDRKTAEQVPEPDLTLSKKVFVPGSVPVPAPVQTFPAGGSKLDALKPWKPFGFGLEKHPTDPGSCRVYHGRLISQINAMTFDEVEIAGGLASLFTDQVGVANPVITVPSQFIAVDGSQYRTADLDWTGAVYLYWETDATGLVTLCELRGPAAPDHIPLPLPPGEDTGKFWVKLGSVDSEIEQDVSGDVFWYGAFVEVEPGSGGSAGSSGGGGPTPSGPGSDKSTAIVPATWSPTGYTALFIMESPEVRFDDIMEVRAVRNTNVFAIDRRFTEVCEKGSVRACSACPDRPVMAGAKVQGGSLVVSVSNYPANVVVRLTGVRKGFAGVRFPDRREDQFIANEATINAAYPP